MLKYNLNFQFNYNMQIIIFIKSVKQIFKRVSL